MVESEARDGAGSRVSGDISDSARSIVVPFIYLLCEHEERFQKTHLVHEDKPRNVFEDSCYVVMTSAVRFMVYELCQRHNGFAVQAYVVCSKGHLTSCCTKSPLKVAA